MASPRQQLARPWWDDALEGANTQHRAALAAAAVSHETELSSDGDAAGDMPPPEGALFSLSYSAHMPESATAPTHNRSGQSYGAKILSRAVHHTSVEFSRSSPICGQVY